MMLRRLFSTSSKAVEAVIAKNAPAAIGPYSAAVKANGFVFVSGQLPIVPSTGSFVHPTDVAQQADQCLKNLGEILVAGGSSYSKVVKATVYLVDMEDFAAVNEVYAKYFGDVKPARACFAVKELPKKARVEIECIAVA
ncbi:mitochondrial translation inhibitor protein [Andalucia godoyi]|uniref:Mitochondrial translation inhibitor protein n=1 Tax=Andalucia godoyi TaxID=505711 RepID=A0A8K0AJ70_ANDGO|nr:mitochondrial translation inhibitor protein [Andalucia godoyi]|eukprot:ANDGO_01685.mRNA.1 mitochondrial translation inhibitor protein (YjgF_YER057c_ UK114 family member endoribonuclease L-PSP)